jgi:hypothetical protein
MTGPEKKRFNDRTREITVQWQDLRRNVSMTGPKEKRFDDKTCVRIGWMTLPEMKRFDDRYWEGTVRWQDLRRNCFGDRTSEENLRCQALRKTTCWYHLRRNGLVTGPEVKRFVVRTLEEMFFDMTWEETVRWQDLRKRFADRTWKVTVRW